MGSDTMTSTELEPLFVGSDTMTSDRTRATLHAKLVGTSRLRTHSNCYCQIEKKT